MKRIICLVAVLAGLVFAGSQSIDFEYDNSSYLEISDANQTGLDISGDISIETWVNLESKTTHVIGSKYYNPGEKSFYWNLETNYNGGSIFFYGDAAGNESYYPGSVPLVNLTTELNQWIHIAVTVDVSEKVVKYYKNGVLVETPTPSIANATSIKNSTAPFRISCYGSNINNPIDGKVKDFRIWNTVRTPEEILANYQKELIGNETGLVSYWKLDGNTNDMTSNGNHLTAYGSPTYSNDVPGYFLPTNIDSGLVAHYTFDGDASDASGNGNDLSLSGDPALVSDKDGNPNQAYDLEASSSQYMYIDDANQAGLDITGDISISAWVNLESYQGTNLICTKWGSSGSRSWYFTYSDVSNQLQFKVVSSSDVEDSFVSDVQILSLGVWYHVAVTWDASASTTKFYINGYSAGLPDAQDNTSIKNTNSPIQIGYQNIYDVYFDGAIDEVQIYNRALNEGEILNLYNGTVTTQPQTTSNYIHIASFDDMNGNNYPEVVGLGVDISSGVPFINLIDVDTDEVIKTIEFFESGWTPKKVSVADFDGDYFPEIAVMATLGDITKIEARDTSGVIVKTINLP